ncbi:uncharacterized protein LOC123661422 [Melitaea cinxia]|uniref:uncharacterized protein LOC123661422 n=1 Tax=Melitaea cinxia TaxID=113334 RepID=UPI001E270231|nr:uncharacterized protein LOC123661422 [Melitaea cinxia]
MPGHRKRKRESSEERLQRKLKKYEQKLEKVRTRRRPPSPAPTLQSVHTEIDAAGISPSPHHNEENNFITKPNDENTENALDEEIINILGDAPDELSYGPPIHKELALRWINAIKNGLPKEKKKEIMKKYLPPENCKTIDAPKLNLEAQAAVPEAAVKRDKAIASKQSQIDSSLTGWGCSCGKERAAGLWNEHDRLQHINYLELNAAFLALKTFTTLNTRDIKGWRMRLLQVMIIIEETMQFVQLKLELHLKTSTANDCGMDIPVTSNGTISVKLSFFHIGGGEIKPDFVYTKEKEDVNSIENRMDFWKKLHNEYY